MKHLFYFKIHLNINQKRYIFKVLKARTRLKLHSSHCKNKKSADNFRHSFFPVLQSQQIGKEKFFVKSQSSFILVIPLLES